MESSSLLHPLLFEFSFHWAVHRFHWVKHQHSPIKWDTALLLCQQSGIKFSFVPRIVRVLFSLGFTSISLC